MNVYYKSLSVTTRGKQYFLQLLLTIAKRVKFSDCPPWHSKQDIIISDSLMSSFTRLKKANNSILRGIQMPASIAMQAAPHK